MLARDTVDRGRDWLRVSELRPVTLAAQSAGPPGGGSRYVGELGGRSRWGVVAISQRAHGRAAYEALA